MSLTEHAGRRDRRIIIEELTSTSTQDESGHIDETDNDNWRAIGRRWAELHTQKAPFGSREYMRADQLVADVSHLVKVRFDPLLWNKLSVANASKFRLKLLANGQTRTLNLTSPPVNEDEQDGYISFMCKEVR